MKTLFSALFKSFSGIPRIIWLLSGVSLINRTGSMVICFLTIYLTQQLGFDLRSAGYVLVFYGVGTICGLYVGGWLTDKIGFRRVQMWALLLAGVSIIGTMYVREFWTMCAMTFLFAFFGDAFRPANQVAIRMNSDDATRTRAFSLMRIAVNLAITVALIGGGLLVRLGWEWLFWVDGLTCFAAAILLFVFVKEKKGTPQYKAEKTGENAQNNDKPREKVLESAANTVELSAYKDRDYLFFVFLTLIGATVFMQIIWTVPVFFKEMYHWNEAQIGIASSFNALIVMTVEMPLIFRIENRRSAMWFVRLGIVLYGVSYLAFFLPTHWAVLAVVLYMIPASLGEIFVMPFSTSWATKRAGTARQGQYMGLYGMAYSVSNVFAPFIGTQVIAAFGYSALWGLMAVMSAVAFVGFWYLEQKNSVKSV
jgi:predicted MFS family arabinose efflux permease